MVVMGWFVSNADAVMIDYRERELPGSRRLYQRLMSRANSVFALQLQKCSGDRHSHVLLGIKTSVAGHLYRHPMPL
jgi:hypothetical protein